MSERLVKLEQQHNLLRRRLEALEELVVGSGGRVGGLGPVVDPPPEDLFNARLIDVLRRFRGGVVDPAPEDLFNVRVRDLVNIIPGGGVVDPAPEDLARLDKDQLKARLDEIDVTRKRLDNLQNMLESQLQDR